MKDDFKQTLKELAERLPEKYKAHTYENQFVIAHQQDPLMYAIMEPHETDIQNSRGILTLLQFIKDQGYLWTLRQKNNLHSVMCWNKGELLTIDGATIAEAVAKAALEVARRVK